MQFNYEALFRKKYSLVCAFFAVFFNPPVSGKREHEVASSQVGMV